MDATAASGSLEQWKTDIQTIHRNGDCLSQQMTAFMCFPSIYALSQQFTVLRLWCAAGWQDRMIKKHHWLLHFPSHLEEHGMTVSCFTTERKHKDVSRHAVSMYNTKYFERGVLDEVINQEFHCLGGPATLCTEPGLLKASPLPKKMLHIGQQILPFAQDVCTGHTLKLQHGGNVSKGDVVLLHGPPTWKCGMVNVHLSHAGQCVSVVTLFSLVEIGPGTNFAVWKSTDDLAVVQSSQILAPVTYSLNGGTYTTLVPLAWRCGS